MTNVEVWTAVEEEPSHSQMWPEDCLALQVNKLLSAPPGFMLLILAQRQRLDAEYGMEPALNCRLVWIDKNGEIGSCKAENLKKE